MTATKRSQQQRVTVVMMRRHIEALVAAHVPRDVPVTRCDGIRSARTVWRRDKLLAIWLPPVKSAVSYAVALHELGHICGRYRHSRKLMTRERAAWRWAERNALIWTKRMTYCKGNSLIWYAALLMQRAQQRRAARRRRGGGKSSATTRNCVVQ
jgi:hypothetical protein